ncbi:uncharacterized protein LOC121382589 [Gigantopelta aegis]|uniref:uncharacterized protein LOC121382589 n=1 Tax=Gigantopelta aegis TaxID=1735272 RepID=UPI001B888DB4|nr:uncharacterized protein LOC121382589 [Gigantopelta aegis]
MQQTRLRYLLFVITLVISLCLVTSDNFIQPEEEHYLTKELRDYASDLILKKMRFRDVDGANEYKITRKRAQERLVTNLAALLSHLRQRQAESNQMRMPSLRFGK